MAAMARRTGEPEDGWQPVVVELAKSGRSQCRQCGLKIGKGEVRVDDNSSWQLNKHLNPRTWAQGYVEGFPDRYGSPTISSDGIYVHLACYRPLHPVRAEVFRRKGRFTPAKRAELDAFVAAGDSRREDAGEEDDDAGGEAAAAGEEDGDGWPAVPLSGRWHAVMVGPSKSSTSACAKCGLRVEKGLLRVLDNTSWQIGDGRPADRRPPDRYSGYRATKKGRCVHLGCYEPPHPRTPRYFQWSDRFDADQCAQMASYLAAAGAGGAPRKRNAEAAAASDDGDEKDDGPPLPLRKKRRRK